MRKYFENMNVFHISYAAFVNKGDGFYYVRARRYPKSNHKSFNSTKIFPSYDQQGFFEKGKTYHITASKTKNILSFKIENQGNVETFQ